MSESVERRLVDILAHPTQSPFGNPIPGLAELAEPPSAGRLPDEAHAAELAGSAAAAGANLATLAVEGHPQPVTVVRIGETLQSDEAMMAALHRVGAIPGGQVRVTRDADQVRIGEGPDAVALLLARAVQIIVTPAA